MLVAGLLALLVPAVRRAARPHHPWWTLLVVTITVALAAGVVVVVPDGRLPIPPGVGLLATPSYTGDPATARPIEMQVPQHPHLAPNGRSSMHNDGWATDSYEGEGPLGRDPEVATAWYGLEECATLAFDSRDRMVGLCGDLRGPVLHVIDPETLHPMATRRLPDRPEVEGAAPWESPVCRGVLLPRRRGPRDRRHHRPPGPRGRDLRRLGSAGAAGPALLRRLRRGAP